MKRLAILAVCFLSVLTINAQEKTASKEKKDTYLKWFTNYRIMVTDTNKDGEISQEEIKSDKNNLWVFYSIPQNFKFTDKDGSGTLNTNELKAMRYREEGFSLQKQADDYDKVVEMYGFKSVSNIEWLKENEHVANKIMSNYEWLEDNKERFNAVSKTNWLGLHDDIVKDITNNYFLILRRPDLAKMLQTRYPRQMNMFVKSFVKYYNAKTKTRESNAKANKLSKAEMQKAAKTPKRGVN